MFYLITLFVVALRTLYFIADFLTWYNWDRFERAYPYLTITNTLAFYAMVALGAFLIGTMNELIIMMKRSARVLSERSAQRWLIAN